MEAQNNHQQNSHHWTVFIDGASRSNPGKAGAGVYITKDGEPVITEGFYLGIKTNNQAEYLALVLALHFLNKFAHANDMIRLASDSQLLVRQFDGTYRVKNEGLRPLHALAHHLAQDLQIDVLHVMREDNKQADALANRGIDSKQPLPVDFIALLEQHNISP